MTVTVKILLIATLILSIVIPFGYYLIGEKNKKRYKRAIGTNIFFYFGAFIAAGIMLFSGTPVQAHPDSRLRSRFWFAVVPTSGIQSTEKKPQVIKTQRRA